MTDYKCPICHDQGAVHPRGADGKPDYSRSVVCACSVERVKKERQEWMKKYCNLPFGTEHMTFESFRDFNNLDLKEACECTKRLADGDDEIRWITLLGKVDRGKTHLAIAACRRYLERGIPAKYCFVAYMLKELKDSFDFEGEMSYRVKFDILCKVPLLVMDDIAVEHTTDWTREQIQTIIHVRGQDGLPLIVTSNKKLDEICGSRNEDERLASMRIASRLQRERWCKVIGINASEHRLAKINFPRPYGRGIKH